MRHGLSEANIEGLIISDPEVGTKKYGLTPQGRGVVRQALSSRELDSQTIIYSSDFLRTQETAWEASRLLESNAPILTEALRERFFGDFDGGPDTHYAEIWEKDESLHNDNTWKNVESPQSVRQRTEALIHQLEKDYQGEKILLISHGDALQILQTFFEDVEPWTHRSLDHLHTGEIRKMTKKGE